MFLKLMNMSNLQYLCLYTRKIIRLYNVWRYNEPIYDVILFEKHRCYYTTSSHEIEHGHGA